MKPEVLKIEPLDGGKPVSAKKVTKQDSSRVQHSTSLSCFEINRNNEGLG